MKEELCVLPRLVCDGVSAAGGVAKVNVTDQMIDGVTSGGRKRQEHWILRER